jgi:hypothetical protein
MAVFFVYVADSSGLKWRMSISMSAGNTIIQFTLTVHNSKRKEVSYIISWSWMPHVMVKWCEHRSVECRLCVVMGSGSWYYTNCASFSSFVSRSGIHFRTIARSLVVWHWANALVWPEQFQVLRTAVILDVKHLIRQLLVHGDIHLFNTYICWCWGPVPMAARSEARTDFGCSKTGVVGSNLTRGMDVLCCPVCRQRPCVGPMPCSRSPTNCLNKFLSFRK